MKTIIIRYCVLSCLLLMLFACEKGELAVDDDGVKIRALQIKGYVMTDTLQFVLENIVIGQAIDNSFTLSGSLFKVNDTIRIRKKKDAEIIGNIIVAETPYSQVKKIFYDGTTVQDNIVLTPVSNPDNMGFRLRFSTPFPDFYGGPVDVEFFDFYIDWNNAFPFVYTPTNIIARNVTGTFGDFMELPPLAADHSYCFKVYKAGTTDHPYTSLTNVWFDPATTYGFFDAPFTAGASQLLSISPYISTSGAPNYYMILTDEGYYVTDFSDAFQ